MMMSFHRYFVLATAVAGMLASWNEIPRAIAKEGSVRAAPAGLDDALFQRLPESAPPADAGARGLSATTIVLDFEGLGDIQQAGNFYDGVGGPDYGVVFGPGAHGWKNFVGGGIAPTSGMPSPPTVLLLSDYLNSAMTVFMTVAAGFTGLSFHYAAEIDGATITVYDGPDGSGAVLASLALPKTGSTFGYLVPFSVSLSGVAKSVRFTVGRPTKLAFDDVTIVLAPAEPPCTKTTYWLWDPKEDEVVGELQDSSATCIAVPYNIEVRPCPPPETTPVVLKLINETLATLKTQREYYAPFYLWGDATATGDVFRSTKPLPAGSYRLYSTFDDVTETFAFTQTC